MVDQGCKHGSDLRVGDRFVGQFQPAFGVRRRAGIETAALTFCVADHDHLSAAQWQLLQALRLYEEGEDYYSVITLAGAAEEIFGTLSRKMDLGNALDRLTATLPMLAKRFFQQELATHEAAASVNSAKNWLKHDGEDQLSFDARFEAEDMLERAIHNCLPIVTSIVNESSEELTSNLVDSISRYDERRFADRSAGTET